MGDDIIHVQTHWKVTDVTPHVRFLYRSFRMTGMGRSEANMLVAGYAMGSGEGAVTVRIGKSVITNA